MKKSITIIVLFILLLCFMTGCDSIGSADISSEGEVFEGFLNTEYNSETDYQYFFGDLSKVVLVGDGYYLNNYDKLYYMKKDTMQPMPVCSKIDCEHATNDCDAYIDSVSALRYYDGYLYYVVMHGRNENVLYRRALDGSKVEKVCDLISSEDMLITELGIHRGYMLYSVIESEDSCALYRVDLNKKKNEKIYTYKAFYADLYRFIGYGYGVLFIKECALDKDYSAFRYDLCYYDYTKNRISVVLENSGGDYAVADDNIYYYADGGVYKYDTKSGNRELFYAADEPVFVSYDGKHLYLDNGWAYNLELINESECRIYIVDMDGKLMDIVSKNEYYTCYGDADYMFQSALNGIEYFDKSKIGTADNGWTEIGINSGYN